MTTNQQIPATQNEAWGFWGTMNEQASSRMADGDDRHLGRHHQPLESVGLFLDSRHGRHFADDVLNGCTKANLQDAINAATQRGGWAGRLAARPASSTASRAACLT
jgi:hypothetical protein